MPKRKREDVVETPNIKQRRVQAKLKVAITKVGHAFKVSKGFERQKLGRRRKNASAQSNTKDVDRIDLEIAALKTLDTAIAGKQHLYKSLLKVKAVSQHPDLPAKVKKAVAVSSDTATLNVNARLCKSNPVQDALSTALDDIQRALGLEVEKTQPSKSRRVRTKDFVDGKLVSKTVRADDGGEDDRSGVQSRDVASEEDEDAGDILEVASDRGSDQSDDDVDSEQMRRIAPSESSEDESAGLPRKGYNLEADLSISGSESEARSESPEPRKAAATTTKSSYLPSLTMAGYISGSDSDVPDDVDLAPRKNRRGQRARQEIWQKKYGTKANHLQKKDCAVRWDSKRGAVEGSARGRSQRHERKDRDFTSRGDSGMSKSREESHQPRKKPVDPNAPIHPSWEAAKKAKEKREMPVAFQGKKVTFD